MHVRLVPAKARTQSNTLGAAYGALDSRVRGNERITATYGETQS
jgi:hypothetical protein